MNFKSKTKFTKEDILLLLSDFILDDKQSVERFTNAPEMRSYHKGKVAAFAVCRKLIEKNL